MTRLLAAAALTSAAITCSAPRGEACAVCGCGDATLTSMGTEAPYRGRMRASLDVRYREDAIGEEDVSRIDLHEIRSDLGFSWAPHERLVGLVTVPLLYRRVAYVNLAERETGGLGDAELRLRFVAFRDRPFGARHLLATTFGVKLPTAATAEDEAGESLPLELQPGTGSVDPIVGLSYATFQGDWAVFTSATAFYALPGRDEGRASSSLRISAALQRSLAPALAARLGVDTRVDTRAIEEGRPEPDSGGFIGFLSPEVLLQPTEALVLVASVRVPIVDALAGDHDESPIVGVAAAHDF